MEKSFLKRNKKYTIEEILKYGLTHFKSLSCYEIYTGSKKAFWFEKDGNMFILKLISEN